ncbi:hypothetical protein ZWY2020_015276 [Hordeum vulgare]|nr:hypothetical protein ZWY2020_015276 [Hordeum vulgare]
MAAAASDQQQQPIASNRYGFEGPGGWRKISTVAPERQGGQRQHPGNVCMFDVPKQLQVHKPGPYAPRFHRHLLPSGYHHWRPELYEMEGYKIDAARPARLTTLGRGGPSSDSGLSWRNSTGSRSAPPLHRYLDLGGETLYRS